MMFSSDPQSSNLLLPAAIMFVVCAIFFSIYEGRRSMTEGDDSIMSDYEKQKTVVGDEDNDKKVDN